MFTVTPGAADQIKKALKEADADGMGLRVAAQMKSDKKIHYLMGFDHVKDDDQTVHVDTVQVFLDPQSQVLLDEATLDFVTLDGDSEAQFIFMNKLDPEYQEPTNDSVSVSAPAPALAPKPDNQT